MWWVNSVIHLFWTLKFMIEMNVRIVDDLLEVFLVPKIPMKSSAKFPVIHSNLPSFLFYSILSGKMNLLKPKTESNWHPHGCVKLDLSELWLGQTCFEFYIPVVPCHAPESGASEFFFPVLLDWNESECRTRYQCETIGNSTNSTGRFSCQWYSNANSSEISQTSRSTNWTSSLRWSTTHNYDSKLPFCA